MGFNKLYNFLRGVQLQNVYGTLYKFKILSSACISSNTRRILTRAHGRGAKVELETPAGKTALHEACAEGEFAAADLLLSYGCKVLHT